MRINHNVTALNTFRQMGSNQINASKSIEKLSSGLRINRAGDDAAGLAISEKMRGQVRGLEQAQRNAQDGISLIQTTEGALNETHSILQRMRELSVQASNDTATLDDRKEIQKEMNELIDEIDRIGNNTEFNTQNVLDGNLAATGVKFHIGANQGQSIELKVNDMRSTAIGSVTGAGLTGTGSIATNFAGAGNSTEIDLTGELGGTTLTVTLDQDYADAGAVVDAINSQIQGNVAYKDLVEAKLTPDNKLTFVNKTATAVSVANGAVAGNKDASTTLFIPDAATPIGNTMTSVNSLKVASPETAVSGGVLTQGQADAAITVINDAIKQVSAERSKLGAYQNRLEHTINNLGTASENLTAAESRVRDVDMAKEMMEFTKNNVLTQAAQAMMAQANQQPQGVLQLLRG